MFVPYIMLKCNTQLQLYPTQDFPTTAQVAEALTAENIFPLFLIPINLELTHWFQFYSNPYSLARDYDEFLSKERIEGLVIDGTEKTVASIFYEIPEYVKKAIRRQEGRSEL